MKERGRERGRGKGREGKEKERKRKFYVMKQQGNLERSNMIT